MSWVLRDARPEDLPALLDLNRANVPALGDVDLARFQWFAEHAFTFRVAWDEAPPRSTPEGAPLGFVITLLPEAPYESLNFLWFKERYERFVYVDRIAVAETAQRRGIGAGLYDDLSRVVRPLAPAITCEVNVRPPNETSLGFHRALGFREVGQQDTEGGTKRVALLVKDVADSPA